MAIRKMHCISAFGGLTVLQNEHEPAYNHDMIYMRSTRLDEAYLTSYYRLLPHNGVGCIDCGLASLDLGSARLTSALGADSAEPSQHCCRPEPHNTRPAHPIPSTTSVGREIDATIIRPTERPVSGCRVIRVALSRSCFSHLLY